MICTYGRLNSVFIDIIILTLQALEITVAVLETGYSASLRAIGFTLAKFPLGCEASGTSIYSSIPGKCYIASSLHFHHIFFDRHVSIYVVY